MVDVVDVKQRVGGQEVAQKPAVATRDGALARIIQSPSAGDRVATRAEYAMSRRRFGRSAGRVIVLSTRVAPCCSTT